MAGSLLDSYLRSSAKSKNTGNSLIEKMGQLLVILSHYFFHFRESKVVGVSNPYCPKL